MKSERYLTVLLIMCFISYFMMINMSMIAEAEESTNVSTRVIKRDSIINDLKDIYLKEQVLIQYTCNLTKFQYDDASFIIKECKSNYFNPFILLGVLKKESDFNPFAEGKAGERGLGQLMENTARPIAENLGYVYEPDKLFDTRYNLKLTIKQLSYLYHLYKNDVHKALTAYNRGQKGLLDYMEQGNSPYENPAMSEYSVKVMNFATEYKEEFENY